MLERVIGPHSGFRHRGSVIERLQLNGAELFKGVTRVAPIVAEYWLEATEHIMNDIYYTPAQKLRGIVSLL